MIDTPSPTAHEADDDPDADDFAGEEAAREMAAEHLMALREMRQMGLELARAVWRQGMAQAEAEASTPSEAAPVGSESLRVDAGLAFARITRAVRLCMALEARTLADEQARRAAVEAQPGAPEDRGDSRDWVRTRLQRLLDGANERAARTDEVREGVEAFVWAQAPDTAKACELLAELRERLIDVEDWDPPPERPVEVVVARIARDLGLDPQGPKRRPAKAGPRPQEPPDPRRGGAPELAAQSPAGLAALVQAFSPP